MEEIARTTLRINSETYENLKIIANAKGKSLNEFINEILTEKLNSYDVEKMNGLLNELKNL